MLDENLREAYHLALKLRTDEALQKIQDPNSVEGSYVASLAEAIDLLITEDDQKFSQYEERFLKRLDRSLKGSPRDYQFLQAEIRLQWAFVYLKFGHELDAALHLRQAYQIAQACREKFPDYMPIRKTTGILQVIVGSVPDKYTWILNLLNMTGSVDNGTADLLYVGTSASPLALESRLLHALVQGFILGKPDKAVADLQRVLVHEKDNRLVLFLASSMSIKNSESAKAIETLERLAESDKGLPLYYADYLRGEAYLHKGDYLNSISAFRSFISHHAGENYIKDAYYKIGLCYWLNGNENDALEMFAQAKRNGKDASEADKSAARTLAEKDLPHVKLTRARYYMDGGYYDEASKVLSSVRSKDLRNKRDEAEFVYRKARLAHRLNKSDAAKLYLEAINVTGQENWYFAPSACLQLGYIYRDDNRIKEAEEYFQRALSFKRYEYKNSIDSKARSALAQLRRI